MPYRIHIISLVLVLSAVIVLSQLSVSCEKKSDDEANVIIVGAGLSGLTAALTLANAGVDVTILEKENRVGGKLDSISLGGMTANVGAQWLFSGIHPTIDPYLSKITYQELTKNGAVWDGQYVFFEDEDIADSLPISDEAKADFVAALVKMATDSETIFSGREFDTDVLPENELWKTIEAQTIAEYLAEFHPDVTGFWSAQLGGEAGGTAEDLSALLLVSWCGSEDDIPMALAKGGNQVLTEMVLADCREMGVTLVTGAEVTEISDGSGTKSVVNAVLSDGRRYTADYAIVSTPSNVTLAIVQGMPAAKRQALQATTYGAVAEVSLQLKNFPTGEELSTVLFVGHKISGYLNQTGNILGNPDMGTIVCVCVADTELLAMTDDELAARVAQDLDYISEAFNPAEDVVSYSVKRWDRGVPRLTPGYVTKYQTVLREPSGRIYLAGDYTHDPSLMGAAWSGARAAEKVLGAIDQ